AALAASGIQVLVGIAGIALGIIALVGCQHYDPHLGRSSLCRRIGPYKWYCSQWNGSNCPAALSIPKLETQSILPDVPGGCFAFIYHDFFFAPVFKHITLLVLVH